jgi:cell division protein FtsB
LDKALNDSKIAKPLAMFGGESAQFRKQVSNQRVSLMEDEKDLIEAIAQAKTKEEKEELQKELDALRAERRELERAMR